MRKKNKPPRLLVCITSCLLVLIALITWAYAKQELPAAIALDIKGQPTLGYPHAKVHIVIFEEPKCVNCAKFTLTILPKIKKEFIDTNKATYTVIPVAFLPGSLPAANALLGVYYTNPVYPNPGLFFTYLEYMYAHQPDELTDWATTETLLSFGKNASSAIRLNELKYCINTQAYRIKIMENTDYGRRVMNNELTTPTIYINGIEVKEISWEYIADLIRKVMHMEGVPK